jgi:hypothetical protein
MAPVVVDEHVVVWPRRLAASASAGASAGTSADTGERWALVAVNNGPTARSVQLPRPAGWPAGPLRDALEAGGAGEISTDGELIRFILPALAGRVLLR